MRMDPMNHGLGEVRLEAGYIQLAAPYIGARSREDIFNITESPAMDPWRLRSGYDRPIPRRIAEQVGLPRNMFGQLKLASALEFPPPVIPLGKGLRREFYRYLVQHGVLSRLECWLLPLARRWNAIMLTTYTQSRRHMWNYYLQRGLGKLLRRRVDFPLLWPRLNGSIYCFCVNRRINDYRAALMSTNGALAVADGISDEPVSVEGSNN